jgi:hypothetical protein
MAAGTTTTAKKSWIHEKNNFISFMFFIDQNYNNFTVNKFWKPKHSDYTSINYQNLKLVSSLTTVTNV